MFSHVKTFIFNFYQMLYLISQELLMVSMDMKEITKNRSTWILLPALNQNNLLPKDQTLNMRDLIG